ncbi:MAG: polymer-forming cytoskeletal protein [Nitrospirae bacterium]|nr:polymer-forming cytoskeletal protein [Nitrospirota bacterium]
MLKQEEMIEVKVAEKNIVAGAVKTDEQGINTIFKGSKVTGNMVVSQDLQMNGDLEGNITAENNASIFIKGTCKGNIDARGGSVEIEGEMSGGNISAGGYVKVTGKFLGGKIQAKDKIHINGEFTGSLESNEVELGAAARGKGEILYKETLCIQKGAKMEGKVTRAEGERMSGSERPPEQKEEPKPKKSFFLSKEPKPRKGFFSS